MTKQFSNYSDLLTFTRASKGHALRPVSYGDELVVNGTFDSDLSGWTVVSGSATVTNGEAVVSYDGANGGLSQFVTVEVGKLYEIKGSLTATTSSSPRLKIGTTNLGSDIKQLTAVGDVYEKFVATTTTISIFAQASGDGSTTIDNVSVKEVLFDQPDGTLTLFEHPDGVPRVEWDSDGNRLGLLVEESRTNLITYSEDFSDNYWTKQSSTVTSDTTVAPDGQLTAETVALQNTTLSAVFRNDAAPIGTNTLSVWLKVPSGTQQLRLAFYNPTDDLRTKDITVTSEWKRFDFTSTATELDNAYPILNRDSSPYVGDVHIWGAQVEAGSFPTSYIKSNSGSTTTRSADVASIPVADFGYNQSALTVLIEASHFYDTFPTFNRFWELSESADVIGLYGNGSTQSYVNTTVGGVQQITFGTGAELAADANAFMKYAVGLKTDNFNIARDGSLSIGDTSVTMPSTIDTFSIGQARNGAAQLNGHIKSIQYYPRRLTNAQLVDLTS